MKFSPFFLVVCDSSSAYQQWHQILCSFFFLFFFFFFFFNKHFKWGQGWAMFMNCLNIWEPYLTLSKYFSCSHLIANNISSKKKKRTKDKGASNKNDMYKEVSVSPDQSSWSVEFVHKKGNIRNRFEFLIVCIYHIHYKILPCNTAMPLYHWV